MPFKVCRIIPLLAENPSLSVLPRFCVLVCLVLSLCRLLSIKEWLLGLLALEAPAMASQFYCCEQAIDKKDVRGSVT